jgi:ABC-type nitrate/sulfonate/bicarbonate transport system substrate-binding protein
LKANGVDASRVKLVTVSDATGAPQALQRGDYDAWAAGSWPAVYTNNGKVGFDFKVVGNVETKGWTTPAATSAGWWSKAGYAKSHPEVAAAFADAVRAFRIWWYKQPAGVQADLIKKYYDIDYAALAGGDPQVLQRLVNYVAYQSGPIDVAATQTWYELGIKYAGEAISKDVDWQSHVFASAKRAAPNQIPKVAGG